MMAGPSFHNIIILGTLNCVAASSRVLEWTRSRRDVSEDIEIGKMIILDIFFFNRKALRSFLYI